LGNSLHLVLREDSPENPAVQFQGPDGKMCRQNRPGGGLKIEQIKGIDINGKARGMPQIPAFPEGTVYSQGGIFPKILPKILMELQHSPSGISRYFRTFGSLFILPGVQKRRRPAHKAGKAYLQEFRFQQRERIFMTRKRYRHDITSVFAIKDLF
jgi:hypothetical protein